MPKLPPRTDSRGNPICYECQFYNGTPMYGGKPRDFCTHHMAALQSSDPVRGSGTQYRDCKQMRSNGLMGLFAGACSPKANLFMKRPLETKP